MKHLILLIVLLYILFKITRHRLMLDLDYEPEEMESVYYINNDDGYDIRVLPVETGSNYTKWGVYKKVNNEIVTLEEHLFLWLTPVTSGSGQVALNNIMLRKRRAILGKE